MTIGIAAVGPNAGRAVFEALAAIERVGTGAIGGFAVFAALTRDGTLHRAETQRGGTRTLFTNGETTGGPPPQELAAATMAGLISSGPDRPAPLAQFLPAEPGIGLVTGHRLPNAAGVTGAPVNLAVMELMRAGRSAAEAVDAVLEADPQADAGLIAVDWRGGLHARNSARVMRRPDIGHARREARGAAVEVLHNAIHPHGPLAALAAEIAMAVLDPMPATGIVTVRSGTPLVAGEESRVQVGPDSIAERVEVTDHRLLQGRHNCAAVYLGAKVMRGSECLGVTLYEPNVVVVDGRIVSLSGQTEVAISYGPVRKT